VRNDVGMIEVDLSLMFQALKRRKWLVLLLMFMSISVGFFYLYHKQPLYQAKVAVIPPVRADIAKFSYMRSHLLVPLNYRDVYNIFLETALSQETKYQIFESIYLPLFREKIQDGSSRAALLKLYENQFLIARDLQFGMDHYVLTVKGDSPLQAKQMLNDIIVFIRKKSIANLKDLILNENEEQVKRLEQQVNRIIEMTDVDQYDWVTRLSEALMISSLFDMKQTSKPTVDLFASNINLSFLESNYLAKNTQSDMHKEVLKIKASRFNENSRYVGGLRSLQKDSEIISNLPKSTKHFRTFRVDGPIIVSTLPVEPNKKLILMLSLVIGIVLSAFVVVIELLMSDMKKSHL